MGSYKALMNALSDDPSLRTLTDEETVKLRKTYTDAFIDLMKCCENNQLSVMLIGGSVIGAVRHKGFIPWDDDLDVAMSREDFEKLKRIFDNELGEKYILSSPNYKNNALNRFPMMLIKDTLLIEAGSNDEYDLSKIKIDIFIIENIPQNIFVRKIKGFWCMALMAMGSYEDTYEHRNTSLRAYMCKTEEGKKEFNRRVRLGRVFSFYNFQKWMSLIDSSCQYNKKTDLMGIPTGRGHYFNEIRPSSTFFPVSYGEFEGIKVALPGNSDDYLKNLYGKDYMTLPPVEKRERHFIMDIRFKEN